MTKRQLEVLRRLGQGGYHMAGKDRGVIRTLAANGLVLGISVNGGAMWWKLSAQGRKALADLVAAEPGNGREVK